MITLAKTKSDTVKLGKRILKVFQYGAKTANECSPFGDDSNPIANMTAIFAETGEKGESVILGYINEHQLAKTGEKRLYSLKEDGSLSFYLWLKNNNTLEVGGNSDNLVRFTPLEEALMAQNAAINQELATISAAILPLGAVYVVTPVEIDITGSKIEEIKCL